MEEEYNNKLIIRDENGQTVTVSVLDIIDSLEFNKSFMIYNLDGNDTVYASILNESSTTYSLDAITEQKELDYINSFLKKEIEELSYEGA